MASLTPGAFAAYSRALLGAKLASPAKMQILRPPARVGADFLRLHNQACRLAQTDPEMAAHPEVARALEQDLIHALITCVAEGQPKEQAMAEGRQAEIIVRFEQLLAAQHDSPLQLPELCSALGVAERTLRTCCKQSLGMSPIKYARLRRLNLVRSTLLRANPKADNVGIVARKVRLRRTRPLCGGLSGNVRRTALGHFAAHLRRRCRNCIGAYWAKS